MRQYCLLFSPLSPPVLGSNIYSLSPLLVGVTPMSYTVASIFQNCVRTEHIRCHNVFFLWRGSMVFSFSPCLFRLRVSFIRSLFISGGGVLLALFLPLPSRSLRSVNASFSLFQKSETFDHVLFFSILLFLPPCLSSSLDIVIILLSLSTRHFIREMTDFRVVP